MSYKIVTAVTDMIAAWATSQNTVSVFNSYRGGVASAEKCMKEIDKFIEEHDIMDIFLSTAADNSEMTEMYKQFDKEKYQKALDALVPPM